eukprot:COSAG01_NODE_2559_length_7453_cov_37.838183_4_plen_278_part_00
MLRAAVLLSSLAVASGQALAANGYAQGAYVKERNIEGEGHKTYTRPVLATQTAACDTNRGLTSAQPTVIVLTLEGVEDVSTDPIAENTGWGRVGSFLPGRENLGTARNPGVCYPGPLGAQAHKDAVACGVIMESEKCAPQACKGSAEKVGDPCCYGTDILDPATGTAAFEGCIIVTNYEKAMCPTGTPNEMVEIKKGDLCIVDGKGSLCGPWQSTAGYDKGDENTGLCEETIFDIPILLFVAICAVALIIIFFQCAIMGLFDLICVKKESYDVRALS